MKRKTPVGNLFASLGAAAVLLYILTSAPGPQIILLPFLICSLAMAGKSIAQILGKDKLVNVFHKIFVAGFLLFWFGFLVVAGYLAIRDQQYSLLCLIVPFSLVGFWITKNKLVGRKKRNVDSAFALAQTVSPILVGVVLVAGVFLLVLGFVRAQLALAFMGVFFLCGGGAFVIGTLTVRGVFDHAKIDVMGLYVGIVFAGLGIGFAVMLYTQSQSAGAWMLIPLLMAVAGVAQIIKCLKNKK